MPVWRMPNLTMITVSLNDGHSTEVPERDYPWVQEWLWSYDSETGRAFRVENGNTIWLYHELLKRHRNDADYVTLGDDALVPLFAKYSAYDEMADKWVEMLDVAGEAGILLPDPADILTCTLTAVLYLYYDWLREGQWFEFTGNDMIIHVMARPLIGPKHYGTLGEWMDSEYTGIWHEAPEMFLDKAHHMAQVVIERLLKIDNENREPKQILEHFENMRQPLDGVLNPVLWLIKSYPTPEF